MAFFFGRLLSGLSAVSLVPLLFTLAAGERVFPFLLMSALSAGLSAGLARAGKSPSDGMSLREGIAITSLGWILCALIGTPFFVYLLKKTRGGGWA